jgi:hypothetical protein
MQIPTYLGRLPALMVTRLAALLQRTSGLSQQLQYAQWLYVAAFIGT